MVMMMMMMMMNYAPLAFPAVIMTIMTTHPLRFQSGHDDDDDDDDVGVMMMMLGMMMMILVIIITSSYHDNHDYASSAFPVGPNGTLETYMKEKSAEHPDDANHHPTSMMLKIITMHPQHRRQS